MKKIILLTTLLSSCTFIDEDRSHIDKELRPFYDSFMREVRARNIPLRRSEIGLNLYAGPLKYPRDGVTMYDEREIVINELRVRTDLGHSYNNHVDSMEIQYIVYHELAHYFLDRGHLPDTVLTIMTPDGAHLIDYMRKPDIATKLNKELFKERR